MSKVPMKRIFIAGLRKQRKQVLETLQRAGVVEITSEDIEDDDLVKMNVAAEKVSFDRYSLSFEQALEALATYAPDEEAGLLSSLEGPKEITVSEYEKRLDTLQAARQKAEKISALSKEIAEDKAAIPRLESRLEALKPWIALDVPLNFQGTEKTQAFIGSLRNEVPMDVIDGAIKEEFLSAEKEDPKVDVSIVYTSKEMTNIFVVCLKEDASLVENALKKLNFARVSISGVIPRYEAMVTEKEMTHHKEKIDKAVDKIKAFAPDRKELQFASDYYKMRADKYDVLSRIPQSENAFFIDGWLPAESAGPLKEQLEKNYDVEIELTEPSEEDDVPVMLRNNPFSDPMEAVVSGYSLPGKGEIDPSFILSLFYYVFFGLMLSDAGYGLLLVLGTGAALLKVKNMKPGTKSLLKTFFFGGISTIIWGILFGSYFGDAIPVIARTFFHKEVVIKPLWFEPLSNPVKLLSFAFGLGVVHLFTGLFISGYQMVKDGRIWDAVCDVLFWFMFIGGGIVFGLSVPMITDMLQLSTLSAGVGNIAKWVALAGALGVVLTNARDKENWALRIGLGLYGVYGATSWLSDILSYSRLLALGLATGVIAQVFNTLGSMFGATWYGVLAFIVIFLIGHVLNIGINLLGAYVHTNRLQYVEFFGKFYEGGGRTYEPFGENTKYFNVKEEK